MDNSYETNLIKLRVDREDYTHRERRLLCEHKNKTYQAKEWDTNVPESYTCDECGKDFDIPEPSFEDEVMEDEYEDE